MQPVPLSRAEASALLWLRNRGGTGVYDKSRVLLAQGDRAAVMHTTWNHLVDKGLVLRAGVRLTVSPLGRQYDLRGMRESETAGTYSERTIGGRW